MPPRRAANPVMAQAADRVETKHQQIHDLQIRLQKRLPMLASRWNVHEFNAFQHDYSQFDSEFEHIKQGLDMVHASLTGQAELPTPPARRAHAQARRAARPQPAESVTQARRARPDTPAPDYPVALSEGIAGLTDANAELNSLLTALHDEVAESMTHWDDAARHAWATARRSWADSDRRQQDIMAGLPEHMIRAHDTGVWFPSTPAAS